MTRLPAKVLFVDRLADQYLITVKVCQNHRCTFDKLDFGENKPHLGSNPKGWLDLADNQNPNLKTGQLFPLWTIQLTKQRFWLIVESPALPSITVQTKRTVYFLPRMEDKTGVRHWHGARW